MEFSYLCENAGWFPTYDIRVKNIANPIELYYKANLHQNTGEVWDNVPLIFSNANPKESGTLPELSPYYLTYFNYKPSYNYSNYKSNPGIKNVTGYIFDENGEPLIGANVIIKGSTIGTITDLDGKYSLMVPPGSSHLQINYIVPGRKRHFFFRISFK